MRWLTATWTNSDPTLNTLLDELLLLLETTRCKLSPEEVELLNGEVVF